MKMLGDKSIQFILRQPSNYSTALQQTSDSRLHITVTGVHSELPQHLQEGCLAPHSGGLHQSLVYLSPVYQIRSLFSEWITVQTNTSRLQTRFHKLHTNQKCHNLKYIIKLCQEK